MNNCHRRSGPICLLVLVTSTWVDLQKMDSRWIGIRSTTTFNSVMSAACHVRRSYEMNYLLVFTSCGLSLSVSVYPPLLLIYCCIHHLSSMLTLRFQFTDIYNNLHEGFHFYIYIHPSTQLIFMNLISQKFESPPVWEINGKIRIVISQEHNIWTQI